MTDLNQNAIAAALARHLGEDANLVLRLTVGHRARLGCHPMARSGESKSYAVITVYVGSYGLHRLCVPAVRDAFKAVNAEFGMVPADKANGVAWEIENSR